MGDESHTAAGSQPCPIAYRNIVITLLASLFWEKGNGLGGAKGCKIRGLWLRERDGKYRRAPAGESCCPMTRIHTVRSYGASAELAGTAEPSILNEREYGEESEISVQRTRASPPSGGQYNDENWYENKESLEKEKKPEAKAGVEKKATAMETSLAKGTNAMELRSKAGETGFLNSSPLPLPSFLLTATSAFPWDKSH